MESSEQPGASNSEKLIKSVPKIIGLLQPVLARVKPSSDPKYKEFLDQGRYEETNRSLAKFLSEVFEDGFQSLVNNIDVGVGLTNVDMTKYVSSSENLR